MPIAARCDAGPRRSGGSAADPAAIVARNTEFFRVYARHRRVFRVLRELAARHEPGLEVVWLDVRRGYVDRIRRWLAQLQAAGELVTADVELLADALGGVLDQLAYTRLALGVDEPTDELIEALGRVSGEIWSRTLGGPSPAG